MDSNHSFETFWVVRWELVMVSTGPGKQGGKAHTGLQFPVRWVDYLLHKGNYANEWGLEHQATWGGALVHDCGNIGAGWHCGLPQ